MKVIKVSDCSGCIHNGGTECLKENRLFYAWPNIPVWCDLDDDPDTDKYERMESALKVIRTWANHACKSNEYKYDFYKEYLAMIEEECEEALNG